MTQREEIVSLAQSYLGTKQGDANHMHILATYNRYNPLPRNAKMSSTDPWCACFWSFLFIEKGLDKLAPIEIYVPYILNMAKEKGIWVEKDSYLPSIGDGIIYAWGDSGVGECTTGASHIGIVESLVNGNGSFTVIEGNKNKAVGRRTVKVNGRYIRGFITPKYDDTPSTKKEKTVYDLAKEVIAGRWGNGANRKKLLTASGYNYVEVQNEVNRLMRKG